MYYLLIGALKKKKQCTICHGNSKKEKSPSHWESGSLQREAEGGINIDGLKEGHVWMEQQELSLQIMKMNCFIFYSVLDHSPFPEMAYSAPVQSLIFFSPPKIQYPFRKCQSEKVSSKTTFHSKRESLLHYLVLFSFLYFVF